jgi:hypothetical protein
MAGEIWANVVFDRGRVTVTSFTAMVDTCSKPLALQKKAHMAKAWPDCMYEVCEQMPRSRQSFIHKLLQRWTPDKAGGGSARLEHSRVRNGIGVARPHRHVS